MMRLNGTEAPNLGKASNRFRKVEADPQPAKVCPKKEMSEKLHRSIL